MKKIFFFIAICIAALSPIHATNAATCDGFYEITNSWVNVRNQPSLGGQKVGELVRYDRVRVRSCEDFGWRKIETANISEGYVLQKYLQYIPDAQVKNEIKQSFITGIQDYFFKLKTLFYLQPKKQYIVSSEWVNVRGGTNADAPLIGKLVAGDIVESKRIFQGTWIEFNYNNTPAAAAIEYFQPLKSSAQYISAPQRFFNISQAFLPASMLTSIEHFSLIELTETTPLPVLMYHFLGDIPDSEIDNKERYDLTVSAEKFEEHLQYLKANDYTTLTFDDLERIKNGQEKIPLKSVVLTFDDGYRSQYNIAFPLLEKYKMKGVFFIITDKIGRGGFMDWDEIKEISASSSQIASHTISHPDLPFLSEQEIKKQLRDSKNILEKGIKKRVNTICYPAGKYNELVLQLSKEAGYTFGRTTHNKRLVNFSKPFLIPGIRIKEQTSMSDIVFH